MNKQKFSQLVRDYHNISPEDRQKLHELAVDYPYSQIIHTLVAKANADAKTDIANQTLGYAAMYATDRAVLKNVMVSSRARKPLPESPRPTTRETTKESTAATVRTTTGPPKESAPIAVTPLDGPEISQDLHPLRDQVIEDLQALQKSKAVYLEWLQSEEEEVSKPKKKKTTSSTTKKGSTTKTKSTSTKKTPAPKAKDTKKTAAASTKTKASKSTSTKKTSTEKSKSTVKKKRKPGQSEIIDDFISKGPRITAKAATKAITNQEDLSQSSTQFTEDLISENLAKILIAQGKTDKAIDIYKKLIWKFPQKKTYFASQIEELKN